MIIKKFINYRMRSHADRKNDHRGVQEEVCEHDDAAERGPGMGLPRCRPSRFINRSSAYPTLVTGTWHYPGNGDRQPLCAARMCRRDRSCAEQQLFWIVDVGIELFCTFRTDAMAEFQV